MKTQLELILLKLCGCSDRVRHELVRECGQNKATRCVTSQFFYVSPPLIIHEDHTISVHDSVGKTLFDSHLGQNFSGFLPDLTLLTIIERKRNSAAQPGLCGNVSGLQIHS